MLGKNEICKKFTEIYPDIGACDIDVMVDYDEKNKDWAVDLKEDNHETKTFLETTEAEDYLRRKQCVSLGLQIAQLRKNIEELHSAAKYG